MKHKFLVVFLAIVATLCMAFGLAACDKTPAEEPAEHIHSMAKVEKTDPTCTADGVKEHWHCAGCGKDFADEEGNEVLDSLVLSKLGHHMTKAEEVAPTCTSEGTEAHWVCDRCHKNFADEAGNAEVGDLTIGKLDHTPEEYIEQEATCDVPGKKWQRCSVCHTPLSGEEEIPALDHDWGEWEDNGDATCTVDGTETRKCRRAGCEASQTQTKKNSALGHDYGDDGICRRENCGDKGGEILGFRREGDRIWFGEYPQARVTDQTTEDALTAKAGMLPSKNDAGNWTNYGYYISKKAGSYMWYIDLEEGGEKYRGVYFAQYRPYYSELNGYESTSYQDDNHYSVNSVYWFKYEPIEWRILEQDAGVAFLAADLILDSQQYYHSSLPVTDGQEIHNANNYAESDIRAWLKDCFYETAFTDRQKALIETSSVNNGVTSMAESDAVYACADTKDKVFLLGYREATNSAYFASAAARKLQASDYAKSQGLKTEEGPQWWLRSPHGNAGYFAHAVDGDGNAENFINVQNTCCGVVPALRIKTGDPVVREDGKIEFGSYPQTEVKDAATTAALTQKAGALPTAENAGAWTDYGYYNNGEVASYMWYIDLEEEGEKYRGVYFTQYRPNDTTIEGRTPNSFQDEHGYYAEKVYWFRFEPIVWRVLTQKQGATLLMADLVLDAQDFYYSTKPRQQGNETVSPNRYAESHIRSWLNETFYETAFSIHQQSLIEITAVSCSFSGLDSDGIMWEVVQDKLFLLSEEEVTNASYGFVSAAKTKDPLRLLKSTDYAKSQNVYRTGEFGYKEYTNWWLRTPGYETRQAMAVAYGGTANLNANCTDAYGVVPAMWLRLSPAV